MDKTKFGQFTLIYGLPMEWQLSGSQLMKIRLSYSLGAGKKFECFGCNFCRYYKIQLLIMVLSSRAILPFRYNKNLNDVGSNSVSGLSLFYKRFYKFIWVFDSFDGWN